MKRLTAVLAVVALLAAACSEGNSEDEVLAAVQRFYVGVLTGDVFEVNRLVSDRCEQKADFLETVRTSPLYEEAQVTVPPGALLLEFDGDRVVVDSAPDGPAIEVNGAPLGGDTSGQVPLEFVREDDGWRLLNCEDYTS